MPRKVTLNLSSVDRLSLLQIIARGDNWRERQRSNTLTLLDDGLSMREVADIIGIDIRTVGLTRIPASTVQPPLLPHPPMKSTI